MTLDSVVMAGNITNILSLHAAEHILVATVVDVIQLYLEEIWKI